MELFRISPVSALELLLGKYLAFGLLNGVIAGAVHRADGRRRSAFRSSATRCLAGGRRRCCVLASLGLGLFISVISDSERQAVQLSLLVLLASVFFSGFVISIDQFVPAVRARVHPARHARHPADPGLLLRGTTRELWQIGALGAIATVTMTGSWLLLRRGMTRA